MCTGTSTFKSSRASFSFKCLTSWRNTVAQESLSALLFCDREAKTIQWFQNEWNHKQITEDFAMYETPAWWVGLQHTWMLLKSWAAVFALLCVCFFVCCCCGGYIVYISLCCVLAAVVRLYSAGKVSGWCYLNLFLCTICCVFGWLLDISVYFTAFFTYFWSIP